MAHASARSVAAANAIPPEQDRAPLVEVLGGLLIAYLNIDEVISHHPQRDEPKPVMIKRSSSPSAGRSHPQHAAAQFAQA